jgi:hypothetical protein
MAAFTLNIQDDQVATVIGAVCRTHNYSPTMPDGTANPVTPAAFAMEATIGWLTEQVRIATQIAAAEAAVVPAVNITPA